VSLVTPGTTLAEPGVIDALVASALPLHLAVTLHGPDAAAHDRVAGLAGAFDRLVRGLELCRHAGLPVQIGHVLTAPAVDALPFTLRRAAELAPSVHLLFFAPEPAHRSAEAVRRGFLASNLAHPEILRRALGAHGALIEETVQVLEGFPLCLVPAALQDRARNDPHSRPDPPPRPPEACARCAAHGVRCAGPEHGLLLTHGDRWLEPFGLTGSAPLAT
jgi:hypothetical protein